MDQPKKQIHPWDIRLPQEEQFTGALEEIPFEKIAYRIVCVSQHAKEWFPLGKRNFPDQEMGYLWMMEQRGYLQKTADEKFMLTSHALELLVEKYAVVWN